ncbi:MAG: hypothetical protein H0X29_08715 [Parachlamydiaceae bacterium]|nr:hypothetical protein [Parachlamydiaceae bacterium]
MVINPIDDSIAKKNLNLELILTEIKNLLETFKVLRNSPSGIQSLCSSIITILSKNRCSLEEFINFESAKNKLPKNILDQLNKIAIASQLLELQSLKNQAFQA